MLVKRSPFHPPFDSLKGSRNPARLLSGRGSREWYERRS